MWLVHASYVTHAPPDGWQFAGGDAIGGPAAAEPVYGRERGGGSYESLSVEPCLVSRGAAVPAERSHSPRYRAEPRRSTPRPGRTGWAATAHRAALATTGWKRSPPL